MTPALAATLIGLGFGGAFVSGLLGVGGAIVMIPLLLYVPPLLDVGTLSVKAVAGVTMVQVMVAATSGMIAAIATSTRSSPGSAVSRWRWGRCWGRSARTTSTIAGCCSSSPSW